LTELIVPATPDTEERAAVPAQRTPRLPKDVAEYVRVNDLTAVNGARSTRRAIGVVAVYAGLAAAGWTVNQPWLWPLVWLLQGLSLLGCIAGQHEAIHGLLYRHRRLNHSAGAAFGAVLLFPYAVYRYGHLEHHRRTNSEGDTQPSPPFRNVVEYLVFTPLSGAMFVGLQWWAALRTLAGRPPDWLRASRQRLEVQVSTGLMLAAIAAVTAATIANPHAWLVLYWAPLLFGGCVWVVLVTIPEHYGCEAGPAPAFATTRTTISNPVMRWFFWGSNFHTAHHLHPNVPSPRLAELHEYIAPRCEYVESSYVRWHVRLLRTLVS
jgi:fatty acid desaturase